MAHLVGLLRGWWWCESLAKSHLEALESSLPMCVTGQACPISSSSQTQLGIAVGGAGVARPTEIISGSRVAPTTMFHTVYFQAKNSVLLAVRMLSNLIIAFPQ